MSFNEFGLSAALLRAVGDRGYNEPTPVQSQAIPAVLAGGDVMAAAQTGTGKTAGFTRPILELLTRSRPAGARPVRALILAPTRELAAQVRDSVNTYGRHLPVKTAVIVGGVGMQGQIQALRRGVDVVVATPGRLLDHLRQGTVDLSRVEILVLDEADRMLDMGFIHDIRKVIAAVPARRQTLLFSATFSDDIRELSRGILDRPVRIEVARRNATPGTVSHLVHPVDRSGKRALLSHLIGDGDWRQVLVFTRTKHGADRLATQLERDGLDAAAIHGNKTQGTRTRTLARFKQGRLRVLVATDIAARGLDIDQLPHVVNFELPNVPEDYVHRIGRTGRAGRGGQALSLVCADELKLLNGIERLLKTQIKRQVVPGFEPQQAASDRPRAGRPANRAHQPGAGHHRGRGQGRHAAPSRRAS